MSEGVHPPRNFSISGTAIIRVPFISLVISELSLINFISGKLFESIKSFIVYPIRVCTSVLILISLFIPIINDCILCFNRNSCHIAGCYTDCGSIPRCYCCTCSYYRCLGCCLSCNFRCSLGCLFCRLFRHCLCGIFCCFLPCLFCKFLSCFNLLDSPLCLFSSFSSKKCCTLGSGSSYRTACLISKVPVFLQY